MSDAILWVRPDANYNLVCSNCGQEIIYPEEHQVESDPDPSGRIIVVCFSDLPKE